MAAKTPFLVEAQKLNLREMHDAPEFFHAATHFVYCRGQEVSMVLRRSPQDSRNVRLLKNNIRNYNSLKLTGIRGNEEQVLVVGALLKEVLYWMKEPVIRRDGHRISQLLLTQRMDRQSNAARQFVSGLSLGARSVLHHVIHLLREVADNCDRQVGNREKSDATTLADEFADYLIREDSACSALPYQHLQAAKFVNLLIRYEMHAFGEWTCSKCPQRPDCGVSLLTLQSWYKSPVPPLVHKTLSHIEVNPEELHYFFAFLKSESFEGGAEDASDVKRVQKNSNAGDFEKRTDSCSELRKFCVSLPHPLIPKECLDDIPNDPDVQSMKRSLEKLPEQHKYVIAHIVRSFTLAAKADVQSSSPLLVALDWFIAQFLLVDNKYSIDCKDDFLTKKERQKLKKFFQILGFYRGTIDRKYEICNECVY